MLIDLLLLTIILLLLIISVSRWNVHPFTALILAGISLGLCLGLGGSHTVEVLLKGFGNTLQWIGIVVILGAYVGEVLNATQGAIRISNKIVKWTGKKKLPWAMGITGYLVSIPVFVDVAYIVLQPITEALARKSKRPVLVIGLALTAGLTVSHTLIPPTPGPLAVASLLEANIGRLLFINGFVGIVAMAAGILWASKYCKKFRLPYDDKIERRMDATSESNEVSNIPLLVDLLPILVPIGLMAIGAFDQKQETLLSEVLAFVSTPMIAVLVGAIIAWGQYYFFSKREKRSSGSLMEQAIVKSALVIMITGAGGAFGYIIRESGMQDALGAFFSGLPFLGFLLPFVVAAILTTATGSITVSLIGAASIVGPMASTMPYSPEIMAAMIGCGSFCVFHANSSFFWLLNRLHEVPVPTLYRTYTVQSLVMGLAGLVAVAVLWMLGVQ